MRMVTRMLFVIVALFGFVISASSQVTTSGTSVSAGATVGLQQKPVTQPLRCGGRFEDVARGFSVYCFAKGDTLWNRFGAKWPRLRQVRENEWLFQRLRTVNSRSIVFIHPGDAVVIPTELEKIYNERRDRKPAVLGTVTVTEVKK